MRGISYIISLSGLLAACGSSTPPAKTAGTNGQSYCDAIEHMCEVDTRAKIGADADVIERSELRSTYIADHVKNPDAIYFRTLWSVQTPSEQAASLRQEAAQAGVQRCPLADALAHDEL